MSKACLSLVKACLVSYATESVMQICHGKRRCTLSADAATFGNPCRKESRMYLKVVYTCVPRKVLREQYEDRPEEDEMLDVDDDTDYEAVPDDTENNMLPSPNLAGRHNSSSGHVVDPGRTLGPIGSPSPPNSGLPGNRTLFKDHKSENKERLTLYVIVSVGAGMLCMMALLIGRLAWSRRSNDQSGGGKGSGRGQTAGATTSLPRPFTDDISEVEPDIDLTLSTPVTMVHHHSPPPAENIASLVQYAQVLYDTVAPKELHREVYPGLGQIPNTTTADRGPSAPVSHAHRRAPIAFSGHLHPRTFR
uniref:SUEL-type lectin domain-containing protein n=1 Tax=Rhodnius prolixus TaxID=13249 RepID=T1HQB8_RHOPR